MQIYAPLTSEARPCLQKIEAVSSLGIPNFYLIGLPAPEVAEARERVRAAIGSSDLEFPRRRVVINLSPASIRKKGTGLDLGIALAILAHQAEVTGIDAVCWGELGLDGSVKGSGKPMRVLYATWKERVPRLLVAESDLTAFREAFYLLASSRLLDPAHAPQLIPVTHLRDAWKLLRNQKVASADYGEPRPAETHPRSDLLPLSPSLEKNIGIAAFGQHHTFLLGPKGTGKTHALDWLIALQVRASDEAQVGHQLTRELLDGDEAQSPVRRVGVHVKPAALIGSTSGGILRPGEFSLAHGGLLIADEFPEWARDSREAFREPLESQKITLTRTHGHLELPAQFVLAATGNLCACGGWPPELPFPIDAPRVKHLRCICSLSQRRNYFQRISGPLLDRLDMVCLITTAPETRGHHPTQAAREQHLRLTDKIQRARIVAERHLGAAPGLLSAERLETLLEENPLWKRLLSRWPSSSLRARHKHLRLALSFCIWSEIEAGRDVDAIRLQDVNFDEASLLRPEQFNLFGNATDLSAVRTK